MAALAWFGMWMGLTSKSVNFATFKTLLFVQVIPWFGITFASGFFMLSTQFVAASSQIWSHWSPYLSAVLVAGLCLAKDFGFITWTRQRLYTSFRERASRDWAQSQAPPRFRPVPPPLPPPIISARVSQ